MSKCGQNRCGTDRERVAYRAVLRFVQFAGPFVHKELFNFDR
jgi:hypothetical protein